MGCHNSKKISAFTIVELIVTMLIGAIVISAGYMLLYIINTQYLTFHRRQENITDLILLNQLLETDFDHADLVFKKNTEISFIRDKHLVKYNINNQAITRADSLKTDTFHFKTRKIYTAFRDHEVFLLGEINEEKIIDEINFDLVINNNLIPFHYKKLYSSETLFNIERNALH